MKTWKNTLKIMKRRTLAKPAPLTNDHMSHKQSNGSEKQVAGSTKTVKDNGRKGGGCHRLVTLAKILVLVIITPPLLNYASIQREMTALKPENGELYDIGWGQKLYMKCEGHGPPTVLFESPAGMSSDVWIFVVPKVAKYAKVCVYDRAGLGFSDRPYENYTDESGTDSKSNQRNKWSPFTLERMVDDIHTLVTSSSEQPQPFLLVGSEFGSLVTQFYGQMFDSQVLGMVLINPMSDDLFEQDGGTWTKHWYGNIIPSFQSLQLGAALGLTRLALLIGLLHQPMSGVKDVPDDVINRQKHLFCHPKHLSSVVDEHHFINESLSQLKTVRMLKSLPQNISVTVISGNYYDEQIPSYLNKAWAKSERNLITKYYPGAKHILINNSDRHVIYKNPTAIIETINRIIRQWKNKLKTKDK